MTTYVICRSSQMEESSDKTKHLSVVDLITQLHLLIQLSATTYYRVAASCDATRSRLQYSNVITITVPTGNTYV